jgi:hypothetical protein
VSEELTGIEVAAVDAGENGWLVRLGWSTAEDPGRNGVMPAPLARMIAARLLDAADDADARNGASAD